MDAIMQLFDFKTKYQFQTTPGVVDYNLPLYSVQTEYGNQSISYYPVYQGIFGPAYANGFQLTFNIQRETYYANYPLYLQPLQQVATGDGTTTSFSFQLPYAPAIPGHIDMMGQIAAGMTSDPIFVEDGTLIPQVPITSVNSRVFISYTNATGQNVVIQDSGQFLNTGTTGQLYGLLMFAQNPPLGGAGLPGGYSQVTNTVNYNTGLVNITYEDPPQAGAIIQAQCYFYQQGLPRTILFYNNVITVMPPPNTTYLIELDAYLSPAAFMGSTGAIPFAYMTEYIARGAARKILSDTGDMEQFTMYEPFFKEQQDLVWKRSQRIFTSQRTQTLFSQNHGLGYQNNMGQGVL